MSKEELTNLLVTHYLSNTDEYDALAIALTLKEHIESPEDHFTPEQLAEIFIEAMDTATALKESE